jgi:hypothetical protein
VDGFGLDRNSALLILRDWNQAKARPPEDEKQVLHKIDDAIKNHPVPSLKRLNADRPRGRSTVRILVEDDAADDVPIEPIKTKWPAALDKAAYYGLPGEIVRTIEPETEADPVALLVQLLVAFGSIIGRAAHATVGSVWHRANEYCVIVGETSAARKGTSWSEVSRFVSQADSTWHYLGGLSSGEGLIYAIRDPLVSKEPIKTSGTVTGYQDVTTDHGVSDKRCLVVETEFGGVLQALARDGNKLSAVVRQGWDGQTLATLTKSFPYRATDAHVSIIGHITADELVKLLDECNQANGFGNRILWVCCRRSQFLPFGGHVDQGVADILRSRLTAAVKFASAIGDVHWSPEAKEIWKEVYPRLTAARPGAWGMVTSRAEAHTLRLALLYSLMDESTTIEPPHLRAALALWDYCQRSAAFIFGDKTGDKDADKILDALREVTPAGLSRTEVRRVVFFDKKDAKHVASKLAILLTMGLVRRETVPTGKRPTEMWFAAESVRDLRDYSPCPPDNHVNHVTTPAPQEECPPDNHVNHVTTPATQEECLPNNHVKHVHGVDGEREVFEL